VYVNILIVQINEAQTDSIDLTRRWIFVFIASAVQFSKSHNKSVVHSSYNLRNTTLTFYSAEIIIVPHRMRQVRTLAIDRWALTSGTMRKMGRDSATDSCKILTIGLNTVRVKVGLR